MNHSHKSEHDSSTNLGLAFLLNLAFTILEIVGGLWTNSLAIVSDAIHDLGDSISLGLAWFLENYSRREASERFTYGYRRFSLLGALINATVLTVGSLLILWRAVPRLLDPEPTNATGMIALAVVGVLINGFSALRLRGGRSMNARVVGLHLLEDVLGWLAVLVVGVVLLFTDYYWLDPLLSILIALWVLYNVVRRLWETSGLFLQSVPPDLSLATIEEQITTVKPVQSVHHTHIWSLDGEHNVFTSHIVIEPELDKVDARTVKDSVKAALNEYAFSHITLEIEYGDDDCAMAVGSDTVEAAARTAGSANDEVDHDRQ